MAYISSLDFTSLEFGIQQSKWVLDRPADSNSSRYMGVRSVVADPWHGKWTAHLDLAPVMGQSNIRKLRSFVARCRGLVNTFSVPATEGPQNDDEGVTVSAAAAGGATELHITGYSEPLLEGHFFTVNDQLCCCVEDQDGNVLVFEPALREAAAAGTVVVTNRPYAVVAMTSSALGWSVGPSAVYGVSFDVEEAILEHADGSAATIDMVTLTWDSVSASWDKS